MKAGFLVLAALAAAEPQLHRRFHRRRAVVTDIVTDVVYVTAPVIVYVDANGDPYATSIVDQPAPTADANANADAASALAAQEAFSQAFAKGYNQALPSAASSSAAPSAYAPALPIYTQPAPAYSAPVDTQAPPAYTAPISISIPIVVPTTLIQKPSPTSSVAPPPASSSSSAPAGGSGSSGSSGSSSGYGLTYSPYRTDNSCKSQSDVDADFQRIFSEGNVGTIRLYGTDCNQVSTVLQATQSQGTKLFLGIYDINNVEQEAKTIVAAVNGDWSRIDTVSVGNELINSGQATVAQVGSAVQQAKQCLTGYTGPVTTVDTFVAYYSHPDLCDVGDYVAANCHAFFDGGVGASGAGQFVSTQAGIVKNTCGGKKVVITESGWPSQGSANRAAVPSPQNQQTAIASLRSAFSDDTNNIFLFSAFNDFWKQNNAGTFGAEQYWGIYGNSASCQP